MLLSLLGGRLLALFSKLGGLRGILQRLSFEVAIVLVLFMPLILYKSLILKNENLLRFEI